ncbi:MAG: CDP-glycerol glycerophosphotransferase family protein [Eubacterium sp.]
MFRIIRRFKKKIKNLTKKFRKRVKRAFSHMPKRKFYYAFYCKHYKVNPNIVLIESFHGQNISDSGLVLAQEILRLYPNKFKIYFATENMAEHKAFINDIGLDVELIDVNTFKYTKILATAKYILTNASIPIYFIKRKEQVYLQMWHGTPLKTLGKKMRLGIESLYIAQHSFLQADYLMQPNEFTKDVIMEDFNLEKLYTGKVVMAGYPRNKIFMQPEKGSELRKKLSLEDKTVYAYMPTWRGTSNHTVDTLEYASKAQDILKQLDDYLQDDQILFVKFHPILRDTVKLESYEHIKPFPADIDGYTFLNCVDALITDYSSVFFDFSLTKKPVILFMYDYEEYLHDRGLRFDVRTLPFRQIYTTQELGECLKNGDCLNDSYTDTEYYQTFFKYDSPASSEKLLKLVLENDKSDLEIIDYSHNKNRHLKVIHPKSVKEKSDFNTLAHIADDNTVVLLEKKMFKGNVSATLHDYYNDSFNYIVTTLTVPRTYTEDLLANIGIKSYQQRIHQRDIERCFPGLDVDSEYIRDYSCFECGCKVDTNDTVQIDSGYEKGLDGEFSVKFSIPDELELIESAVLTTSREILSLEELTDEEKASGRVSFNLNSLIEELVLYDKKRYIFGVTAYDKRASKKVLVLFTDNKKLSKASKSANRFDKSAYYYKPILQNLTLPVDYYRTDLKKLIESTDEKLQSRLENYDLSPVETSVAVLPYISSKSGNLSAVICNPDNVINYLGLTAKLTSLKCKGSTCILKAELPGWNAEDIQGAVLNYRSKVEEISIPLKTQISHSDKGCKIKITMELSDKLALKEVFWDIRILASRNDYVYQMKMVSYSRKIKWKLFFTNCQCIVDSEHIIFPYFGKKSMLCFCYREKTEYDTSQVRIKEITAYAIYRLFRPIWKRKKIWVVFEKFCKTAQDNSYFFFKYCMENLSDKEKKNIYYIIDKREPEYQNIKQYDRNVIQFMSVKHMLYSLAAKICISSDSTSHLYVWRSKPSVIRRAIKKKKEMFLQHGVIALKQVHNLFGKNGSSPMTFFVTSSMDENQIIVNDFKYNPKNVPITGLARWDALEDKSTKDNRFILMMPTWRSWLEEVSSEMFMQSDYYKYYSELLTSDELSRVLENNGLELVFYLHPKFAAYIDTFKDKVSKNVHYVAFGEKPLNDLMMCCSMLITDYSSVCWDVLYQNKPVLFYQFDYELYNIAHGSYINMEKDLLGDRATDAQTLIEYIDEYAHRDFKTKEHYQQMIDDYFLYRDNNNSKRIYEFLKFRGY